MITLSLRRLVAWLWRRLLKCLLVEDQDPFILHAWSRHQMKTFSALLPLCVTGGFSSQRPVTRGFDVFFDLHLNKWLSRQSRRQWFQTPSRPLWRHCNVLCHGCRLFDDGRTWGISSHGSDMMTSLNENIFRVTGLLWGEPPATGGFPSQRPMTWSFDIFFDLRLNKRLNKLVRLRRFETPSRSLWRHCKDLVVLEYSVREGWFSLGNPHHQCSQTLWNVLYFYCIRQSRDCVCGMWQ